MYKIGVVLLIINTNIICYIVGKKFMIIFMIGKITLDTKKFQINILTNFISERFFIFIFCHTL